MRVVSLVPSATETLLAWGIEPVAVTRFCEQPHLRAVGGTKDPDVAAIIDLAPDLVVVCDEENRAEDAAALEAAGLTLHVLSIRTVADVGEQLRGLADAVDARDAEMPDTAVADVDATVTAFVPIWRRPWITMNADTYGSSLLAALGVANVFAEAPDRYPTVTLDDVASLGPDVVLAPSEPYPFSERHRAELESVASVTFLDGADLFWWGVRTPAAITRLTASIRGSGVRK
jgi:ABC-type Fe3+-hydroxamate transport system substrate-binding protein